MNPYLTTGCSYAHSGDRYVRLRESQLWQIVFEHLETAQDPAVLKDAIELYGKGVLQAGWAEWIGRIAGTPVSLAWDWVQLCSGDVRSLICVPPRANVKVVDAKGYDLGINQMGIALFGTAERLDWKPHVHRFSCRQ